MNDRIVSRLPAATMIVIAIGLLVYNWYLVPERAMVWGLVMAGMCATLVGLTIVRNRIGAENPARVKINGAIFAGALIIVGSLVAAAAGEVGWIVPDIEKRIVGIIIAVTLIVTGNYLPKVVRPINAVNCDPVKAKAAERFAGWCFVIAGFIGLVGWVVLDTDGAKLTFAVAGLSACALVVLRWFGVFGDLKQEHNGAER